MCGIAGYFGRPRAPGADHRLLQDMIGALAHRGPDGKGVHQAPGIGLAHARLSIIDLDAGAQPMTTEDGELTITFNGEIFNYVELRRELIAQGARFRTQSDTEVILKCYERDGVDCVNSLNGDFAFAIWDRRKKRLMLARDRMGVRPLYYTRKDDCLYFASEAKALFRAPGVVAEPDYIALDQIFTFWFPLAPRTPFKNVLELPPGHVLLAEQDKFEVRPYWRLEFPQGDDWLPGSESEIAEAVGELLADATRIRLRADVPVGAYLSGGLDSSIVAALAKQTVSDRLRTFSVTFTSVEHDESPFQDQMVQALGTRHSSVLCTLSQIGTTFPSVVYHAERPILRTAPAPLYSLSKLTRDHGFKVVLTGEGADEVFGGYDIFKEAKLRRFCAAQPGSKYRPLLLQRLYPYLPRIKGQSQKYLESFFGTGLDRIGDPLFSHLPRFKTTAATKMFFSEEMRRALGDYDALADLRESLPAAFGRWHPLCQAQYLEASYLLPGYILSSQGDRMAMANGVEGRFPFLDHRVVELANRIAPKLKIRGLREKHILRQAAADLLPKGIADRVKQPYRAPDAESLLGGTQPAYIPGALSELAIDDAGYFNAGAVRKLAEKFRRAPAIGFRENAAMVGIVSTQLWHSQYIAADRTSVEAVA